MLYVRHMAWLSATPEGDKKSRGEALHEGGEGSPFLQMPPLDDEYYIIKFWEDCGSVGVGSSGIVPLSWSEIKAWRTENELSLTHFEITCIRKLSQAYVSEFYVAKEKDSEPPYSVTEETFDRVAASNKMKGALQRFSKKGDEERYTVEEL